MVSATRVVPHNYPLLDRGCCPVRVLRLFAFFALDCLSRPPRLCRGWDQTGSNGANLSFPADFGILPVEGTPDYDKNNWLVGLVNAAPYIAAASWYVSPSFSLKDSFIEVFSAAAVGFPTHSTFTSGVAVPSSLAPSSVSSRSSAPVSVKPGNNSSSVVCCLASVWDPRRPQSPYLPPKTPPLQSEVVS